MSKLYVFCIGGTGSRVVKALSMLFATGCKLSNGFSEVVPIIIDPDISNGDLTRSKDILLKYQQIRKEIDQPDDFFAQEIKSLNDVTGNPKIPNPDFFHLQIDGTTQKKFRDFISYNTLSFEDKHFINLLFTKKNLDSDLSVGFKGNPNMGSIVLNQFTNSQYFKSFESAFADGDAIFIVNSIFGGTGAAGFPLLLKHIRNHDKPILKNAPIGGVTYLPYFKLTDDDNSAINSESFEEKAKIALEYYNRTIIDQGSINCIYFVGNKGASNVYDNFEGKAEQKNNAHFLELAGAMSMFDFCIEIGNHGVLDGSAVNGTIVKEYGIQNDTDSITFDDLDINDGRFFGPKLTKYKLFIDYLERGLSKSLNVSRWTKSDIKMVQKIKNSTLDENYFKGPEYSSTIKVFNQYFKEWLLEMEKNKPSFCPFINTTAENALHLLKNKTVKKNATFKPLDIENCMLIEKHLNKQTNKSKHTVLVKLFAESTEKVLVKNNLI